MDKVCKRCSCVLTDDIKRGNSCKSCYLIRRKELKQERTSSNYIDSTVERLCIQCQKPREDAKHGRYCISCFNLRRSSKQRGTKPGSIPVQVNESNEKMCSTCSNMLHIDQFRVTRNTCKKCEQQKGREYNRHIRETKVDEVRKKKNAYNKKRCETDFGYKLLVNHRIRIWQIIKLPKNKRSTELLDCDRQTFMDWITFNFKENMTIENYGKYWHIDHVIPCASFNFQEDVDVAKCFHWSNMVPLEGYINIAKKDKIDMNAIAYYRQRAEEFIALSHIKDKNLKLLEPAIPRSPGNM